MCGPCGILTQGVILTNVSYLNAGDSSPLYTDPAFAESVDDDPSIAHDDTSSGGSDDDDDDNKSGVYFMLFVTFLIATILSVGANFYFFRELGKARAETFASTGVRSPMN